MAQSVPAKKTDFDVLSAIFVARQSLERLESDYEVAKENRKVGKENLERAMLMLNAYVIGRRDEIAMPKMRGELVLDGMTGGPIDNTICDDDEDGANLPGSMRDEHEETVAYVRCSACNMSYLRNAKPDRCEGCGTLMPDLP